MGTNPAPPVIKKMILSTAKSVGSVANKGDYNEKDLYVFST